MVALGIALLASACTEEQRDEVGEAIESVRASSPALPAEDGAEEPTEGSAEEPTEAETREPEASDEAAVAEEASPAADDEGASTWPWLLAIAGVLVLVAVLAAVRSSGRRRKEAWRRQATGAGEGATALLDDVSAALDASDAAPERWMSLAQRADQLASGLSALEPDAPDDSTRMDVARLRSALADLRPGLGAPPAPGEAPEIRRLLTTCAGAASSLRARLAPLASAPPLAR